MTNEQIKMLLGYMPVEGWLFLASCFAGAKLETSAIVPAYHAQQFVEKLNKSPAFQAEVAKCQSKLSS